MTTSDIIALPKCAARNRDVAGRRGDEARELVEAAHAICPYSKATAGNIEVELNLI